MKIEECVNYLLTQVQLRVNMTFKENLRAHDITPAQYVLLYYLWEEDGLAPSQLASLSGLDASTITGLLTRLEDKKLIVRKHSDEDRRSVNVHLTKSGANMRDKISEVVERSNAMVMSPFSEEEQTILKSFLKRLIY